MKRYIGLLLTLLMLVTVFDFNVFSNNVQEEYETVARWDFNESTEKWNFAEGYMALSNTVLKDGMVNCEIIGDDAHIVSPNNLKIVTGTKDKIRIGMRNNTTSKKLHLYYINDEHPYITTQKSYCVELKKDTDINVYEIELAKNEYFKGEIQSLYFYFDEESRGDFTIDFIEYSSAGNAKKDPALKLDYLYKWDFQDGTDSWKANAAVSLSASSGVLKGEISAKDPQTLTPSGLQINTLDYGFVKIRMKNMSDNTSGHIYFMTSGDTKFSGDKHVKFTVSKNDTSFKEYIIDLTSCKYYKGTVTQLRIDPTDADKGSFEIDYVGVFRDKNKIRPVAMFLDGEQYPLVLDPIETEDDIYLPLSEFSAALKMGASENETVFSNMRGGEIILAEDDKYAIRGNSKIPVRGLIYHLGKKYVNKDFIDDVFGCSIDVDKKARIVNVSNPNKNLIASVFSDNMVLQDDKKIDLYGYGREGGHINVSVNGKAYTAVVMNGEWKLSLPSLPTGGPYEIEVSNDLYSRQIKNVMSGEVWLCVGEKNMSMPMSDMENSTIELSDSDYPDIRFMNIPLNVSDKPQNTLSETKWNICSATNASTVSAVSYYFSKELHKNLNKPIGIIIATCDDTSAEAWTSGKYFTRGRMDRHLKDGRNVSASTGNIVPTSSLYNGMIAPIKRFNVKGVVWYQGESNVTRASEYDYLMKGLIKDWRATFNNDKLPFLMVQMPKYYNGDDSWQILRESQKKIRDKVNDVYLISTIDMGLKVGDNASQNLYLKNKYPVGHRLAVSALDNIYNLQIEGDSPEIVSAYGNKDGIFVEFKNTADGLVKMGSMCEGFEFITDNGKKVKATAEIIDKNTVKLSHSEIKSPSLICYGIDAYPEFTNLYSSVWLPIIPFKTEVKYR